MALSLRIKVLEGCDGIKLRDVTGAFSVEDQGGYGPENDIEGPQDFSSYTLSIWAPGLDPSTEAATYTQNLKLNVPVPDENDWYTWQTAQQSVPSGVWFIKVVGTTPTQSYTASIKAILLKDVKTTKIDPAMLAFDPMCPCKEDCDSPLDDYMLYLALKKNGICDLTKAQQMVDYLYSTCTC